MRELSEEMAKAGIIDEMMEEAFEDMDPEDMEEESAAQVSLSCPLSLSVCPILFRCAPVPK